MFTGTGHILRDLNFKVIAWPDRLNKSGLMLSQSEGQMLIDIMNDHGLEQLVHFPTREKNTLDLILTSLPGQFQEIHCPDKLSDHHVVSGTLKVYIPPKKETSEEGVFISERNWNWKRQMNLMVSIQMCSTKMSIAKSRSQIGRLLS